MAQHQSELDLECEQSRPTGTERQGQGHARRRYQGRTRTPQVFALRKNVVESSLVHDQSRGWIWEGFSRSSTSGRAGSVCVNDTSEASRKYEVFGMDGHWSDVSARPVLLVRQETEIKW